MRRTRTTRYWTDKYPNLIGVAAARRRSTWQEVVAALAEGSRHHPELPDDVLLADVMGYMPQQYTSKLYERTTP